MPVQSPVHGDIGLQNSKMDVIRPDMDAEQMPGTMCARIENGLQNSNAVLRAEGKLGFRHEPPGLLLPSRVGGDDGIAVIQSAATGVVGRRCDKHRNPSGRTKYERLRG